MTNRGRMLRAAAILLLAGSLCLNGRARAQAGFGDNADTGNSQGFAPIKVVVKVVDRDGRPVGAQKGILGVRLDPKWVQSVQGGSGNTGAAGERGGAAGQGGEVASMTLPDPLIVDENISLPLDDPNFQTRFDTNPNSTVTLTLLQPTGENLLRVGYEYRLYDASRKARKGFGNSLFTISSDSRHTLPNPLRLPWSRPHAQIEWILALVIVVALVGFITFGIYRPFYAWMLGRSNAAAKSRDWAVSLWLFLLALVWGGFLLVWAPRDVPFLGILLLLGLLWLLHLIFSALRPREEGA